MPLIFPAAAVGRLVPGRERCKRRRSGRAPCAGWRISAFRGVIAPKTASTPRALLDLPPLRSVVGGKHVLILRGNGGRELLAETLRTRRAIVECIPCYRRSAPRDAAPLMSLLRDDALDALTLSSSEGLRNLLELLDTDSFDRLRRLAGVRSASAYRRRGGAAGRPCVVATGPADAGSSEACNYPWLDHER